MRRRRALLDPADVQGRGVEVDLIPAKVGEFGHTQAVAVGDEDHGGVAMTVAVLAGGLDQALDLGLRSDAPGSGTSALALRRGVVDCSIYGGW